MNTACEYWSRGGSLIHTTPDGRADVAPPPTTRIYALAGFAHFGGPFPPESDGTLVSPAKLAVRTIGGAELPTWTYQPRTSDEKHAYVTLVTQVGSDGNELAGLRTPFLTAPLATHTGWNLRDPATGFATDRTPFSGSLIPFATLPYTSRDEYLGRFTSEALRLTGERYMSAGDLQFVLPLAAQLWEWAAARR